MCARWPNGLSSWCWRRLMSLLLHRPSLHSTPPHRTSARDNVEREDIRGRCFCFIRRNPTTTSSAPQGLQEELPPVNESKEHAPFMQEQCGNAEEEKRCCAPYLPVGADQKRKAPVFASVLHCRCLTANPPCSIIPFTLVVVRNGRSAAHSSSKGRLHTTPHPVTITGHMKMDPPATPPNYLDIQPRRPACTSTGVRRRIVPVSGSV